MSDDDLLRALAEAHREHDPLLDARWDALARGTLGPDEREALRALDPEAYALFVPLDEGERAAVTDRILAARGATGSAGGPPPKAERSWSRSRVAKPISIAFAAAAMAVAAAALVMVRPGGAPLPLYSATVIGEQDARGLPPDPATVRRIGPGSTLDVVLRPTTPVRDALVARVFLEREGRLRTIPVSPQVSEDGAVRIRSRYEALFAGEPPGRCEIVVAIGRDVPEDLEPGGADPERHGARIVRVPLLLVDRP